MTDIRKALEEAVEREYNPFEPDNQSRYYTRWKAALAAADAQPDAGLRWCWHCGEGVLPGMCRAKPPVCAAASPPAPAAPAQITNCDEFFAEARRRGITHWTPEMTAAVAARSAEIAAPAQQAQTIECAAQAPASATSGWRGVMDPVHITHCAAHPAQQAQPPAVALLQEVVDLCAVGDIDEHSEHEGWAGVVRDAKAMIAAQQAQPLTSAAQPPAQAAQRKPLTDGEIAEWADGFILAQAFNRPIAIQIAIKAARWAERAHGIEGDDHAG
jgi:hypothetical protein